MKEFKIVKTEFIETVKINQYKVSVLWKDDQERHTAKIRKQSFDIVTNNMKEMINELESWGIYPDEFTFSVTIKN